MPFHHRQGSRLAEPQHAERAFSHLVGRAGGVLGIAVLLRPTACPFEFGAHVAAPSQTIVSVGHARDHGPAGRPQNAAQLLPCHVGVARGQQAVGNADAQQAGRLQAPAGDTTLAGVLLQAHDLEIGDLRQLVGELTLVAVQNETVALRNPAFLNDPPGGVAVELLLRVIVEGPGIERDFDFLRCRASAAVGEAAYLPRVRADEEPVAADGQAHGIAGHLRLPDLPSWPRRRGPGRSRPRRACHRPG